MFFHKHLKFLAETIVVYENGGTVAMTLKGIEATSAVPVPAAMFPCYNGLLLLWNCKCK